MLVIISICVQQVRVEMHLILILFALLSGLDLPPSACVGFNAGFVFLFSCTASCAAQPLALSNIIYRILSRMFCIEYNACIRLPSVDPVCVCSISRVSCSRCLAVNASTNSPRQRVARQAFAFSFFHLFLPIQFPSFLTPFRFRQRLPPSETRPLLFSSLVAMFIIDRFQTLLEQ